MKRFAKAVAGLLMIAIAGFPAPAAATPCLRTTQDAMCCRPGSPMIAKPAGSKAAGRVEMQAGKPACCCNVSPRSTVPAVLQTTSDQPMDMAGLESLAIALAPPVLSQETGKPQTRWRVPEPSQAVLCTFLI